ncbi:C6 zinc finger domain-containing protein [Fusarium heterosporum]|uniref:C6 zinc finger domain-containing protein n=1 Tax=Fusarium heterosporum TaxID=42747 RepID=A0A8H5X0C0_FUSHE|nr:C6 zinc finger domain-containing protein [Fusarium heterosporum]
MSTKIPKACEPCRIRKKRCDGAHPCRNPDCQTSPHTCIYRPKARNRRSKRDNSEPVSQHPLLGSGHSVDGLSTDGSPSTQWVDRRSVEGSEQGVQHEVYHSVTETHLSPTPTDSSQLFYGPSSYFAFLQQIHRGVLSGTDHGQSQADKPRSGVDTFMQRSIFFGTPSRISPEVIRSESIQIPPISKEMAQGFLQGFKTMSYHRLPFYTQEEMDGLLENWYDPQRVHSIPLQTKASFLAILAIGALSTPRTDLAETLFTEARREAVVLDDAVTLKTLQLSLLFADYQVNMGRPNSTYQALTLGRRSSLRLKDITYPFPTEPLPIARLCHIARIMEDAAEAIYGRKASSIRQLYITAEELRGRLNQYAQDCGIASAQFGTGSGHLEMHESMTLHSLYYHAVILIFRPFLIAQYAMRVNGGTGEIKEMWLRQACRHAVDAAQDSIEFSANINQIGSISRYQGFFIECSCAVLLYDILCNAGIVEDGER